MRTSIWELTGNENGCQEVRNHHRPNDRKDMVPLRKSSTVADARDSWNNEALVSGLYNPQRGISRISRKGQAQYVTVFNKDLKNWNKTSDSKSRIDRVIF